MKPLAMLVVLLVTSAALIAAPVSVPPVAAFSSVCVPTTCLFDGHASTGSLVRFRWTFGDKVITENRFPPTPYALHPYAIPGVYSVKLQVLDAAGQYDSVTISVVVPPIAVVAVHDTTAMIVTVPTRLFGGLNIDSASAPHPFRTVYAGCTILGNVLPLPGGSFQAFRISPPIGTGPFSLSINKLQGVYASLQLAADALFAPPPIGWIP